MTISSNIVEVAENQRACVYAFYRLCKLHKVSTGTAADFFALPDILSAKESFRSDFFRLLASVRSSQNNLSQDDIVSVVALAMGGSEISQLSTLQVPDNLKELLTRGWRETNPGAAHNSLSADLEEAEDNYHPASQIPTLGSAKPNTYRAQSIQTVGSDGTLLSNSSRTGPSAPTFTSEKALEGTAHLKSAAKLNSTANPEATTAPGTARGVVQTKVSDPQLSEDLEHLESDRIEVELRLRQIEQRLNELPKVMRDNHHPHPGSAAPTLPSAPIREPQHHPRKQLPTGSGPLRNVPRARSEGYRRWDNPASRAADGTNEASVPEAQHHRSKVPLSSRIRGLHYFLLLLLTLSILGAVVGFRLYSSHSSVSPNNTSEPTIEPGPPSVTVEALSLDAPGATSRAVSKHSPLESGLAGEQKGKVEGDVTDTLLRWASAASNNDVAAETSFYAPRLERYFLKRNVSRDYVGQDKRRYREKGNVMQSLKISDLSFQSSSDIYAVVSFRKSWSVLGPSQTGKVHTCRSRLWLRRTPQGWKIVGEQDFEGRTADK